MRQLLKKTKLLIWVLFFFTFFSQGQEDYEIYHKVFDSIVGIENTNLYQGEIYIQKFRTINDKTEFYNSNSFLKGSIVYGGQTYYDVDLKYDVFQDQVLLNLNSTTTRERTLKLIRKKIDEFKVTGDRFVKLVSNKIPNTNYYGFYQNSLNTPHFSLYTKFRKKALPKKNRSSIYYEFVKSKSEYVLQYKNKYYSINSKKELITLFPQFKKEIQKFHSTARTLKSKDLDSFMVALMKQIGSLM